MTEMPADPFAAFSDRLAALTASAPRGPSPCMAGMAAPGPACSGPRAWW